MDILQNRSVSLSLDPFQVIDSLSAEIAVIQQDGIIVAVNQAWKDFALKNNGGIYSGLGIGENYKEVCLRAAKSGDVKAAKVLEALSEVLEDRKQVERIEYPCHSPEVERWFTLRITPLREDGETRGALLSHQDTTRRKKADMQLRESEEKYRQQFENSLYGILITQPDGTILDANPAAQKMLNRSVEAIRAEGRKGILDMEDPRSSQAVKKRRKQGQFVGELVFKKPDGSRVPVELSTNVFRNADGQKRTIIMFRDLTRQKEIENELVDEKKFSDSLVKSLPGTFVLMNENRELVKWNENLEKDLGYTADELQGINPLNLVVEEDRPRLEQAMGKVWEEGEDSVEIRVETKWGQTLPYFMNGIYFESGDSRYIIGAGLNLEDRFKMEQELRFNKELFGQLFDNSPIGIALIDKQGQVNMVNQSFRDIFGFEEDEMIGKRVDDVLVPEKHRNEAEKLTIESFSGDTFQKETFRINKKGEIIPVLIAGVPVHIDGKTEAVFGMYVDITERKRLENEVQDLYERERAERLKIEEMFEQAPSAICLLDGPDHSFTYVNKSYKKLVGNRDLIGKTLADALPEVEDQGFVKILDQVFQTGEPYLGREVPVKFNLRGNEKELEERILDFIYKPMKAADGSISGIFVEALDVTEQVKTRKQLERSLHEKNILLQEVHHRVKNNLALITSLLELQKYNREDETFKLLLRDTQNRIHSIAKIHDVLYQNQNLVDISFDEYIDDLAVSVEQSFEKKSIQINQQRNLKSISLNVNQAISCGLLLNELLTNTYKHAFPDQDKGVICIELDQIADKVHLRVKDNGIGLPADVDLIKGTDSLGASLIQTLVKQLNANIDIGNGQGTDIKIQFKKSAASGSSNRFLGL